MNRILILTAILFIVFGRTYGCLNGEGLVLKDGTMIYVDKESDIPYGHSFFSSEEQFKMALKKLDSLYFATKDLDYLSDKGVIWIIQKRYDEAINLYLEIEKLEPNRYSTASNIGTAYELAGQNEDALKWISRSLEIDPGSHHNSEWIHQRILEAKIKGGKFFTTKYLLNTEFGNDESPTSILSTKQLTALSNALYFQLNERMSFVKPTDAIVAQLLFDFGNIAFLLDRHKDALETYALAKEYGFHGELFKRRMMACAKIRDQELRQLNRDNAIRGFFSSFGVPLLCAAVVFFVIYKARKAYWNSQ